MEILVLAGSEDGRQRRKARWEGNLEIGCASLDLREENKVR